MISDGPCTTECDSGDWSAVKQEPHDVCMMHCYKYILLFVIQNNNFAVTILNIMIEILVLHVLMSYQQE